MSNEQGDIWWKIIEKRLQNNQTKKSQANKQKETSKKTPQLLIDWTLSSSGEKSDPYLGWMLQSYDSVIPQVPSFTKVFALYFE